MNVFAVILWVLFSVGALTGVALVFFAVVHRIRDKRTPEERWADEHGDEHENPYATGARFVTGITFTGRPG
ncbi:hypothetical protein G7075_05060 [Phycicoccus sp. HDW14]|uniref:hypothetical protein n=1 Tax=Phycicoccus sp. HDW14 TaxID=2714941 RepID=UPI00140AA390|nr:hypothetical protein [Phycicoccus sp. HDW14]QIM20669.1 hypothetical protein G7075_05060 [Phycicoccus sp. HDW14]